MIPWGVLQGLIKVFSNCMPSFWQQTVGSRAFWHNNILAPQHFGTTTFWHHNILVTAHHFATQKFCHSDIVARRQTATPNFRYIKQQLATIYRPKAIYGSTGHFSNWCTKMSAAKMLYVKMSRIELSVNPITPITPGAKMQHLSPLSFLKLLKVDFKVIAEGKNARFVRGLDKISKLIHLYGSQDQGIFFQILGFGPTISI